MIKKILSNTKLCLFILVVLGFIYKAYPHIFLIPRWVGEEEAYFMLIRDVIESGVPRQFKYSSAGEIYLVYVIWLITKIDPILLCQYINPAIGALTVIPVYFLFRKHLDKLNTYLACSLFTFSEVVFYRSSHFGSPEISGFFIIICALYFYDNKKHIHAALLIVCSFYFHLLPFSVGIGIIICDVLIHKPFKQKIVMGGLCLIGGTLFYSTWNPYEAIIYYLKFNLLISNLSLSNINLYSIGEILNAVPFFMGMVALGVMSIIGAWRKKQIENNIFLSMLLVSVGIFVYGWFGYSQDSPIPPTRTILYFVLPLSYYSLNFNLKWKKVMIIGLVCGLMVSSSVIGSDFMLRTKDSLSINEHEVLDEIQGLGLIDYPNGWWGDYGVQLGIATRSKRDWTWSPVNNLTYLEVTMDVANYEETFSKENTFTHVFYSERMKNRAMFLIFYETNGVRTLVIRKPVEDIWSTMDEWSLFYEKLGVKIYKKVDYDG